MNQDNVYTNEAMLNWTGYFAEMMDISPEKIKLLNICQKKKNVIPSIESHKRVLYLQMPAIKTSAMKSGRQA